MQTKPSSAYQRISTPRLHEGVVQQITRQILGGDIKPGGALPTEPELSQQFGVSRTVIREAVRVLVSKGLVTAKHGSGVWVQSEEHWDFLDPLILFEQVQGKRNEQVLDEVLEIRRVIEVEVAALAAARRTEDDLRILREALEAMRVTLADPDAYTAQDIRFHDRILGAARNRLLQQTLRPVSQVLEVGRRISIRRPGVSPSLSLHGHEEIFSAIQRADAELARTSMRQHLLQFEDDIRVSLRSGMAGSVLRSPSGEER